MSGSENQKHEVAETQQLQRTCDYCGEFVALLYCRADAAKLCLFCDRKVHFPNELFSKHTRAMLCDACGDSPASVLCFTEDSVLCQNCDYERHNHLLTRVHQWRPIQGFSGCSSVNELLKILGLAEKSLLSNEGLSVLGLEDLITSTASSHKNHKGGCRRQKDEILSQLNELIKLENDLIHAEADAEQGQDQFERDMKINMFPSYEAGVFCWHGESSDPAHQIVPSDASSLTEYGSHTNFKNQAKPSICFNNENLYHTPKATPHELTSHERDSALLRYRQKKKNRRYDKHIRYESRKVRAQTRMRIKGRFVKDQTQK